MRKSYKLPAAMAWLRSHMTPGQAYNAGEVLSAALRDGHAERTVQLASNLLHIEKREIDYGRGRGARQWEWVLPVEASAADDPAIPALAAIASDSSASRRNLQCCLAPIDAQRQPVGHWLALSNPHRPGDNAISPAIPMIADKQKWQTETPSTSPSLQEEKHEHGVHAGASFLQFGGQCRFSMMHIKRPPSRYWRAVVSTTQGAPCYPHWKPLSHLTSALC